MNIKRLILVFLITISLHFIIFKIASYVVIYTVSSQTKQLDRPIINQTLLQLNDDILIKKVTYTFKENDNLINVLVNLNLPYNEIHTATNILKQHFPLKKIRPGQIIEIEYTNNILFEKKSYNINKTQQQYSMPEIHEKIIKTQLISLLFKKDPENAILLKRQQDGKFIANAIKIQLTKQDRYITGNVDNNLFDEFIKNDVPTDIMMSFISLYGFTVDFQRDLRKGDKYAILYEEYYDDNSIKVKNGNIIYSEFYLKIKDKTISYYLFHNNKIKEYYDFHGNSAQTLLMKTPINGARISSRFGMRRHPILGYSKMHQGIDFAAPIGTPIFAAGDGVITYIGWNGTRKTGYGKYIRIRHNDTYSTAYGHLSRFNYKLKKGSRVKQRDIIGYVGNTGGSTGPHLHYEILKNKHQINPIKFTYTTSKKLTSKKLNEFKRIVKEIDQKLEQKRIN